MAKSKVEKQTADQGVSIFVKYVWFYLFFFSMMMMIASFGLIAES